ncbi:MAG: hypothetical protein K2O96_04165, partial [Lachnospiraceae bacterium]|nr:hypothetical protein [Lachnospiraceae bacterium]
LADAQDLKSCGTYTPVPVRFRSPALSGNSLNKVFRLFFCDIGKYKLSYIIKRSAGCARRRTMEKG